MNSWPAVSIALVVIEQEYRQREPHDCSGLGLVWHRSWLCAQRSAGEEWADLAETNDQQLEVGRIDLK